MGFGNVFNPDTGGTVPDAEPAAGSAWVTTSFGDLTHAAGSYTTTYEASSVSGFAHKMIINDRGDSNYADTSTCATVYIDTGISYATIAQKKNTICQVVLEFDIEDSDYNSSGSNTNAQFFFGCYMGNNTTFNSNNSGGASGMVFISTAFRPMNNILRFGTDSNLGTGINTFNDVVFANDAMAQVCLDGTARIVSASGSEEAGFQGISCTYKFLDDTTDLRGDRYENKRQVTAIGTGNIILGAFFGQRRTGGSAGNDQTLNFNLNYILESRD